MKLEDLTVGQRVRGPNGTVYVVRDLISRVFFGVLFGVSDSDSPWKAILDSEECLRTCSPGRIEVDQTALDGFVSWEGGPLCS